MLTNYTYIEYLYPADLAAARGTGAPIRCNHPRGVHDFGARLLCRTVMDNPGAWRRGQAENCATPRGDAADASTWQRPAAGCPVVPPCSAPPARPANTCCPGCDNWGNIRSKILPRRPCGRRGYARSHRTPHSHGPSAPHRPPFHLRPLALPRLLLAGTLGLLVLGYRHAALLAPGPQLSAAVPQAAATLTWLALAFTVIRCIDVFLWQGLLAR